jgi:hypothetical protein
VYGEGYVGVEGVANAANGIYGVAGEQGADGVAGVIAFGNLYYTGDLVNVDAYPFDPSKELRYAALQGREVNTFFRGSAHIVAGHATIRVPRDFGIVTSAGSLTVVATPTGGLAIVACMSKSLDVIEFRATADVDFDYQVTGIRKGYEHFSPVAENRNFVPESPGKPAFVDSLRDEELARLVTNGTLNPDHTANLQTAHRLGWDESARWSDQPARRPSPATPPSLPAGDPARN